MSYIERAVYDYVIKIITDGIKVLFSKRFILFTILLIASAVVSVIVVNYQPDPNLVQTFLLIMAAISISFIVAGLVARILLSTMKRFVLLIILIAVITIIGVGSSRQFINIPAIVSVLLEFYPLVCLILWTIFMPLAGFGFARGMFYNKVTGSLLFLGKPENDKKALFFIFFALIALIGVGLGLGIFVLKSNAIMKVTGLVASFGSIIIFLIVFGVIIRNDTLNSTLSVFFVSAALPSMAILLISNGAGVIGTLNYALLIFSLIYTAQGQARRASKTSKMTEEEVRLEQAKKKHEKVRDTDPFGISKLFNYLSAEGIVLIFLGTFLGYVLLQLEYFYDLKNATHFNSLYLKYFSGITVGQLYEIITIIITTLFILFIILTNFTFPPARSYYKSDLIRLQFLPSYDEIKAYFIGVQSGEISKKDMTADAVKLVGGQLAKASLTAGRGLLGKIGLGNKKQDEGKE